jgi:hypothetical protein
MTSTSPASASTPSRSTTLRGLLPRQTEIGLQHFRQTGSSGLALNRSGSRQLFRGRRQQFVGDRIGFLFGQRNGRVEHFPARATLIKCS